MTPRIRWAPVIVRAAEIVNSDDTSVTLRQLFYRLVSEQLIANLDATYKQLSARTAAARREGDFPDLIDRSRIIHRSPSLDSPSESLSNLTGWYRRDRTADQDVSLFLSVEKAGLIVQLESWFDALGIPILCPGGYASQTYVNDVRPPGRSRSFPYSPVPDLDLPELRAAVCRGFGISGRDADRDRLWLSPLPAAEYADWQTPREAAAWLVRYSFKRYCPSSHQVRQHHSVGEPVSSRPRHQNGYSFSRTRNSAGHSAGVHLGVSMSLSVGYLRVSSKGQAKDGQGLDVQRQLINEWAKAHKVKIQAWYSDEGISGTYPVERRPGLLDAINDVKARAASGKPAGLVVRDFSRLAREEEVSVMIRHLIAKSGGELRSADATQDSVAQSDHPIALFQRQLFANLDQLERDCW